MSKMSLLVLKPEIRNQKSEIRNQRKDLLNTIAYRNSQHKVIWQIKYTGKV